jgi:hypothetical protein
VTTRGQLAAIEPTAVPVEWREAATEQVLCESDRRPLRSPVAPAGLAPAQDCDAACHQVAYLCIPVQSFLKRETDERDWRELPPGEWLERRPDLPIKTRQTARNDANRDVRERPLRRRRWSAGLLLRDPESRWQRGLNENNDGLLCQYLLKKSDLSIYNQRQLDAIASPSIQGSERASGSWHHGRRSPRPLQRLPEFAGDLGQPTPSPTPTCLNPARPGWRTEGGADGAGSARRP